MKLPFTLKVFIAFSKYEKKKKAKMIEEALKPLKGKKVRIHQGEIKDGKFDAIFTEEVESFQFFVTKTSPFTVRFEGNRGSVTTLDVYKFDKEYTGKTKDGKVILNSSNQSDFLFEEI